MGRIPSLKMQVSPILILILQEIMVVCILNYGKSLGGFFSEIVGDTITV